MPIVFLGNSQAINHVTRSVVPGEFVTEARIDPSTPLDNAVTSLTHNDGVFRAHSTSPAPAWVESDHEGLATALAEHWGCPIGRPLGWGGPPKAVNVVQPATPAFANGVTSALSSIPGAVRSA